MTVNIKTSQVSQEPSSYRVERRGGCVLVYGMVPLTDMEHLARLAPKDAVMDIQLSKRFGATFVFGLAADLQKLKEVAPPHPNNQDLTGLSKEAIEWLATGERGLSSETIFSLVTGFKCIEPDDMSVPRDTGDFRRCQRLLEQCPEIAEKFVEVMSKAEGWERLAPKWKLIADKLDQEAPNWRKHGCRESTKETSALLKLYV